MSDPEFVLLGRDGGGAPGEAAPGEAAPALPPVPEGLVARALATLDPGYFAWVMASGIVSVGTDQLGYRIVSEVTLGVTLAAFAGLVLAYLARSMWFTPFARHSLQDPSVAMAYFTFVAGANPRWDSGLVHFSSGRRSAAIAGRSCLARWAGWPGGCGRR